MRGEKLVKLIKLLKKAYAHYNKCPYNVIGLGSIGIIIVGTIIRDVWMQAYGLGSLNVAMIWRWSK